MDGLVLEWLEGLACHSPVFIELLPGLKRPPRPWAIYEAAHIQHGRSCLQSGLEWLRKGKGLGFLLRGHLWVLDIDSPGEVERYLCDLALAGIFPPYVRTPSGGAHLYFRYPAGFDRNRLKNHLCHPRNPDGDKLPIDFKLGPRTLLVAPGTKRGIGCYTPMTPWRDPPELGPDRILPSGEFWRAANQPFLTLDRSFDARIARACRYLLRRAPVSISGSGGHRTLAGVCAHLVVFLRLDPALAFHLLTHGPNPWNARCKNQEGASYPWSQEDLWRACCDAVDAIPRAGVLLHQRVAARTRRDTNLRAFTELIRSAIHAPDGHMVSTETLCSLFNAWAGADLAVNAFSRSLRTMGIRPKLFSKRRISGIHLHFEAFQCLLGNTGPARNETRDLSTSPQADDERSGCSADEFGVLDEIPFLHTLPEAQACLDLMGCETPEKVAALARARI